MRPLSHRLVLAGLAIVALAAIHACSYSAPSMAPSPLADVTITIVGSNGNMSFSPNPGVVPVGKTVAWRNATYATYRIVANGGAFDTGDIPSGGVSAPVMMSTAGSFPYHTSTDATMVGTLTVQ